MGHINFISRMVNFCTTSSNQHCDWAELGEYRVAQPPLLPPLLSLSLTQIICKLKTLLYIKPVMLLNITLQFCFTAETTATYKAVRDLTCPVCSHSLNTNGCCDCIYVTDQVPFALAHCLSMGVTAHLALLKSKPSNNTSSYECRGAFILSYSF